MKKFLKDFAANIRSAAIKISKALTPGKETVTGGGLGIIVVAALTLIIPLSGMIKYTGIYAGLTMIVAVLLAAALTALLADLVLNMAMKIPLLARLAVLGAIPVVMMSFGTNIRVFLFMLSWLILFSFMAGAGIWLLLRWRWRDVSMKNRVLVLVAVVAGFGGLAGGTVWLLHPGKNIEPPVNAAYMGEYLPDKLDLPDPSSTGNYSVAYLTYGSGEDKRRKEYGEEADLITSPVNGSAFLPSWEGLAGKLRTWYFGFDRYTLPVNAKVWYPGGKGPFPLVLAVHGNHLAQDWSEGGYAYLGEQLVSSGYIFASVDQNFLNGSYTNIFNGLSNENNARGWLLLKHLQQWEKWNSDSLSPFFNMVDMNNIALVGHSRGGEAVGHAALFNTLPHYPDDARERFDFNFNIRSIIAIAPSDRQYEPAGTGTPLKDINYFVLQGSHDADVQSFLGMRQYNRLSFSPGFRGFKAALYIYRANHGQFNTSWGRKDGSSPRINLFNLQQLLPEQKQQQAAKVYIGAFLEATLKGETGYRQLFMDHRKGREWLPETIYLNQYKQSAMLLISDFNEDLDLTTTSMEGGWIETKNLTLWREQTAKIKWGEQETRSAVIGWNNNENDSLPARYTFMLPEGGADGSGNGTLFLTLADADESPDTEPLEPEPDSGLPEEDNNHGERYKKTNTELPDHESKNNAREKIRKEKKVSPEESKAGELENMGSIPGKGDKKESSDKVVNDDGNNKKGNENSNSERGNEEWGNEEWGNEEISNRELTGIDFTIELADEKGRTISFPLESCSLLQPRLKKQMTKMAFMRTAPKSETVFSFFYFKIDELSGMNSEFNPENIEKISLVFNRTESGVIILNNIGLMPWH